MTNNSARVKVEVKVKVEVTSSGAVVALVAGGVRLVSILIQTELGRH